ISCWAWVADPALSSSAFPLAYINEDTSVTPSEKAVALYSFTYTSRDFYLISPALSTINGNYHIKFDAKLFSALGTGSTLQIGTLDSNTNVANFTQVGSSFTPTLTNQTFTSLVVPATTGHQYVAIKFTPGGNHSTVLIDNIIWEAATSSVQSVAVTTQNNVPATITTANGTLQLEAAVLPSTVSQNVTWTVQSGTAFASVDNTGLVTAIANGTATIRATSVADTSVYGEITITVNTSSNSSCNAVTTIDEDFETFTTFPENCWSSNKTAPMADLDANTTSGNQFISLYSYMTANDPIYLVTPELSTIDGNHLLEFDIVSTNATSSDIEVGTMTDNTDLSTFVPVGTSFNPTVGTHSAAYIPANAGHKYVAIKFTSIGVHQAVSIDNV